MNDVDDFLEHHGIKGQKWGVRHDPGHEGERVKLRKLGKLDQQWMDKIRKPKGWDTVAVNNRVADKVNASMSEFNSRPEYKNSHLDHPERPATKKYMRDFENMQLHYFKEAVKEIHGVSPSGAFRAHSVHLPDGNWGIKIRGAHIEHATMIVPELFFRLILDKNGKIVGEKQVKNLEQSDISTDDFLSHFGIRGMRWGVRNKNKRFTFVNANKKPDRKTSSDYRKAQQLKKRGHASLSNEQLKKVNERLNLEKNYKNLNPNALQKLNKEKKTIETVLALTTGVTSIAAIATSKRGQQVIRFGKLFMAKHKTKLANKAFSQQRLF